jgi:protein-tyrosine phosphatase
MKDGVVAVHCNHGKGRTGTAIIAFILYMGLYDKAQEALAFYNCRRFISNNYGVDQPCQTRYLTYIEKIKNTPAISKRLIAYQLTVARHKGLSNKYFIQI